MSCLLLQRYGNKVNYYSNPDVTFPATGTPTGVEGVSNNAKVMTEVRFNMAAMGDESGTCRGAPAPVKTNGQWGKWSKWGECEANCKKTRVRQCDNPSPSNGGKDCKGVDEAERVCSGGKCGTGEGKLFFLLIYQKDKDEYFKFFSGSKS